MAPDVAARLEARRPDGRRPQVMYQRWESLLFLHWSVSPSRIEPTLPRGLNVDTYNGQAFLGITPFFMRNVRPVALPALPWLSDFHELNVRTYVFDERGIPGIWFYSLDCDQPLAVAAARTLTGLPYFNAEMHSELGEFISYSCRRTTASIPGFPSGRRSRCSTRAGEPAEYRYRGEGESREAEPGSLEFFLLERYYLFSLRAGTLVRAQVSHSPYEFRDADAPLISALPGHWDGFTDVDGPRVHECFVDALDVKVFATQKVS